jgi:hypothetical protein
MANFLCVLTRTEKSLDFFVGFRIFLSGFFETHTLITNFFVCKEKNAQKNSSPTGVFEFSAVKHHACVHSDHHTIDDDTYKTLMHALNKLG